MTGAWEFVDRSLTDQPTRISAHGPAMSGSAEHHSIALASMGVLTFEWDAINDRVSRPASLQYLYGYPLSEIEPTFAWLRGLMHPDDLARDRKHFLEQIAARAPLLQGQYRVRHKDGHLVTVKSSGAAEYNASGNLIRVIGCTIDANEVLEVSHARLTSVISHSNDAIFSTDREGLVQTWNDGACRLYDYTATEMVGKPLSTIVPDGDRAASAQAIAEILAGETRVFQATRLRKDGSRIDVEISGAPIRAPNGRVLGISTIHRDVTNARRTAVADARLAAVVGASHDAIVTLDPSARVETWNKGAEELFGWTAPQAVGKPASFIVPEDRMREHDMLTDRIASGESAFVETVRMTNDERRVSVAASFSPLVDGGGVVGSTVTFRDISERLAREAHIHLLLKELSHRSKNLLAVVQGIARQSAMRTPDPKEFLDNFSARLRALASSHDLIVQENWHGADMHALVSAQTGAFEITEDVVRIKGERLLVKPEAAQNIGLSLHELASNALRHGALSSPEGHVEIDWHFVEGEAGRQLQITWREFGGPAARLPKRSGFGILVLSTITPRALGGKAELVADTDGLRWQLEAPVENIVGDAQKGMMQV